ncbi:TetR/AcrR family transcriptional regulator [Microbacterium awajiense]|uniref:TetR/AcrR family transcriptional regulator n=1 Tax=Microbacterium awajiense TaxID=415214 RepID=A0ABP7AKK8_9MICO
MTTETSRAASAAVPARRGRPGYDRDRVLEIAVELFNEQGYDATSVSDLAARLGLSRSALYHHFTSKEELLAVALDTALGGLEGVLERPEARQGSAAARLQFVIAAAVEVLVDQLPSVTLLLRVRGNGAVEQAALARRRLFDQRVAALVADAQREGLVRADLDAALATRLVFGMVNSVVEWYRPDGPVDRDTLAREVLAVVLEGLRTR